MREKKHTFFLRQHIRLSPKIQPSNRSDIVRLKFLEYPYRLWYKIPKGIRTAILSLVCTGMVPYFIYYTILNVVKYEEKAKLIATLGNDETKIAEMLGKIKLR